MSRLLLIRCDALGCTAQTETGVADTGETRLDVPREWLTVRRVGLPDRHYCSEDCLRRGVAPLPTVEPLSPSPRQAHAQAQVTKKAGKPATPGGL